MFSNDNVSLIPKISESKNFTLLSFPNISVSQVEYSEGPVGMTFIKFNNLAKVNMEIRGGWPGYISCLSNNDKQLLAGINICGGSLLGLESTTGLTAESLKSNNYSYFLGFNSAVIYSKNLNYNKIYPDKQLGRFAYQNFTNKLYNGQVGAGLSASHGQGWAQKEINDIKILCLVVNNALGDVYNNNIIIHNAYKNDEINYNISQNTTIVVLIINLDLDNDELKQMSNQVNATIGKSIRPFNTLLDGDIFYTCSTKEIQKIYTSLEFINIFSSCSEVVEEAIMNSIL